VRFAVLTLLILLVAAPATAAETCREHCGADANCSLEAGACLLEQGEARAALTLLKAAHEAAPDDDRLVRAVAAAYLAQGNSHWATRRLLDQLERHPEDQRSRAWAAWILIREGDLRRARGLLEDGSPAPGPLELRFDLLDVALIELEGEPDVARQELLGALRPRRRPFAEDRALIQDLRRRLLGDHGRPLSARAQLSVGFTSNAAQSSPEDVGASEGDGSPAAPVIAADLVLRLEPWTSRWIRPLGELRARLFAPLMPTTLDHSWADLGARAGLELGGRGPRLTLAWSGELLALHGGDIYKDPGPRWFLESHRGELEFTPTPELQLFFGAGRRIYRERPRTRTEVDGGVAILPPLPGGWGLAIVAVGRWYDAREDAWDGGGATALARVAAPLPGGGFVKLKVLGGVDHQPDSAAWYLSPVARTDVLVKAQLGPWSPLLPGGVRLGASYGFTGRHSTIDDYGYTDHRLLGELRWEGAWHPFAVRPVLPDDERWPLPWGLDDSSASGLDRVRDLLRQEDSARRGSSCVD
jgi:hypothetical protein